jgi:hypothetical protein
MATKCFNERQKTTGKERGQMRKAVISAIALAGVTPLFLVGTALRANAATSCLGSGCNGQIAANTTCVNDAFVAESANITKNGTVVGIIELEYSPSCRATWARGISNLGHGGLVEVNSNSSSTPDENCPITGAAGTGCNTKMINDDTITSYAIGNIYDSSGNSYSAFTASF